MSVEKQMKQQLKGKLNYIKANMQYRPLKEIFTDQEYLTLVSIMDGINIPIDESFVVLYLKYLITLELKEHARYSYYCGNAYQAQNTSIDTIIQKVNSIHLNDLLELCKHLIGLPSSFGITIRMSWNEDVTPSVN
jgi:hypothetical protein